MGDLNARVGGGVKREMAVGPYRLGEMNKVVKDGWTGNELIFENIWFQNHARGLWISKNPGNACNNQLDYITIKNI